jgi:hypothetical protein
MSYAYCNKHHVSWDSDKHDLCLECEEELECAVADANREMGLPEDGDFGDR